MEKPKQVCLYLNLLDKRLLIEGQITPEEFNSVVLEHNLQDFLIVSEDFLFADEEEPTDNLGTIKSFFNGTSGYKA